MSTLTQPLQPSRVVVIRGETKVIDATIIEKDTKKPFDLTGQTAIKAIFEKDDDTKLTLLTPADVLVVSEPRGELKITLSATNTATLKIGENQSFEIEVTFPTKTVIGQVIELFDVIARL